MPRRKQEHPPLHCRRLRVPLKRSLATRNYTKITIEGTEHGVEVNEVWCKGETARSYRTLLEMETLFVLQR